MSSLRLRYAISSALLSLLILLSAFYFWDIPIPRPQISPPFLELTGDLSGQNAPSRVVEMEGLKMGVRFSSQQQDYAAKPAEFVTAVLDEVHDRFASALRDATKPTYPSCSIDTKRYATLQQGSRSAQTVSIAINVHNSQAIVPTQSKAIIEALAFLFPNYRVYVSLFENGSDDLTRELLSDFAAALDALGTDGIFMHTSRFQTSGHEDRMNMLSEIRNHALRPLLPYAAPGTLIFMNDVATCPEDILELVLQMRLQGADAVIGTDWITMDNGKTTLYDLWATRGINGELPFLMVGDSGLNLFSTQSDWMKEYWITQNKEIHDRWLSGLPIPVYSGFGGMTAFDASLFTQQGLRFRSSRPAGWEGGTESGSMGLWGQLVNDDRYLEGDCPGDSECKLIFRDIWNIKEGKARVSLAPRTRTVYQVRHWAAMAKLANMWSNGGESEAIDWDKVSAPRSVVCIASRTKDGAMVDAWGMSNSRYHLMPIFERQSGR